MGKAKTRKALMKRIKITGTGKILKRRANQGHFNAKDSGKRKMNKRGTTQAPTENRSQYKANLPDRL